MTDKLKLLVIDDEPSHRATFRRSYREIFSMEFAENGADGVTKIGSFRPDAIVCDLMMPILNGDEVITWLRRNRSMLYDDKTPTFVLHSATPTDRATAALTLYGCGAFAYDKGESLAILKERLSIGLVPNQRKPALLVVDDAYVRGAATVLYGPKFNVACAKDGQQGLSYIKVLQPDVVILDDHMPNLTGYQVLESLSGESDCFKPRIALCSGTIDDAVRAAVSRYGNAQCFQKPTSSVVLTNYLLAA